MEAALAGWGDGLAAARLCGGSVSDPPRLLTLEEGYALADRAARALGTPAGWKIGATSAEAMACLAVSEPIRGRLFAERIWRDGDHAVLPGDRLPEAEPEVALLLAHDLPAGADPVPMIGAVRLAAEIVRPSHPRPFEQGVGFIVADNAAGLGALLGPEVPVGALSEPATLQVRLLLDDVPMTEGSADAVLGNPLQALLWLAAAVGGLPAGTWVLTGAMARAVAVPAGARLTVDGGRFGMASASF
jgi:2-keto-4-pentenoate hydratase